MITYYIQVMNVKNLVTNPLLAGMVVGVANGSSSLIVAVLLKIMPELRAFRSVGTTFVVSMSLFILLSSRADASFPLLTYISILVGSFGATGMTSSFFLVAEMRVPPQNFSATLVIL